MYDKCMDKDGVEFSLSVGSGFFYYFLIYIVEREWESTVNPSMDCSCS